MRTTLFSLILLCACVTTPSAPRTTAKRAETPPKPEEPQPTLEGNSAATVIVGLTTTDDTHYFAYGTVIAPRHVLIDEVGAGTMQSQPLTSVQSISRARVYLPTSPSQEARVVAYDSPLLLLETPSDLPIGPVTVAWNVFEGPVYQPSVAPHGEVSVRRAKAFGTVSYGVPEHCGQHVLSTDFCSRAQGSGIYDDRHQLVGLVAFRGVRLPTWREIMPDPMSTVGGWVPDAPPCIVPVETIRKFLDRNDIPYRPR